MFDLSHKCEEYLSLSGHTIGSLAKISGLSRQEINRLIKGLSVPSSDFLTRFCDSLHLNLVDRSTLFELHEKASAGPAFYHSRKYISSMIAHISDGENAYVFPGFKPLPASYPLSENTLYLSQTHIQIFDLLENLFIQEDSSEVFRLSVRFCKLLLYRRNQPHSGKING